ncbi:MAG: hypothetical protein MJ252_25675 [archaeon]|nr:hypothetical protein [archaeon]
MSDLEQKQDYLREAILDKGYDGNQFMTFLQEKRGDEINLDEWSLDDLHNAVNEFISKVTGEANQPQQQNPQEVPKPQPEPSVTAAPPVAQPEQSVPTQEVKKAGDVADKSVPQPKLPESTKIEEEEKKQPVQQKRPSSPEKKHSGPQKPQQQETGGLYTENKETLSCLMSKRTSFSDKPNPSISLSLPEKIEGGIFSKSYVTYLVEAIPLGTKVRKRYSDFEWLREMMQKIYIGSVIPPIPKKNYGDRFNETFISKRMRGLERFMNGLAVDPLMRDSPVLCDFLTIENEPDWNSRKNVINRMKVPDKITDTLSLTGDIKTSVSAEKEMYFTNIKDNSTNNETLIKKLIDSYKLLIAGMNEVSRIMGEISGIWRNLYENSEKYFEDKKTTESYNIMTKLMQDWSDSEKRQADLINIDLKEYFRYVKNEFISMKDLIGKVENSKAIYKKAEEKLIWRKDELFRRQDISKWDLDNSEVINKMKLLQDKEYAYSKMIPKETAATILTKYTYGFYLNRIIEEYERIRVLNGKRHSQKVSLYCKKNTDIITDLHVGIADLVSSFAEGAQPGK